MPTDGAGDPNGSGEANPRSWFQKTMTKVQAGLNQQQPPQSQPQSQQNQQSGTPTAVKSWQTVGQGVGKLASLFLEDGDVSDWNAGSSIIPESGPSTIAESGHLPEGLIKAGPQGSIATKPIKVQLGKDEAVVPLSYRATAKVRPSAAMPLVRSMQKRSRYRAA